MAETKAAAELAFDAFVESYALKYAKAADCLSQDRDALLAFYDFPAEHWKHLRTTDEIDKHFLARRGIFKWRGRPRGEAWRIGRKRRQAALQFMPCRIEAPARPLAGAGAKPRQNARSSSAPVPRRASPGSGVP